MSFLLFACQWEESHPECHSQGKLSRNPAGLWLAFWSIPACGSANAAALTWDRAFVQNGNSHIYVDQGKTKNARRYIPLTEEARKVLGKQRQVSQSQFAFVRFGPRVYKVLWYREPISRHTVSQQFSQPRDEMGLPWDAVLHSTRHTALTDLGAAGADAFTIQAVAGHASVTTSQRYVQPVPETMARAVARLEEYRKMEAESRSIQASAERKSDAPATVSATPTDAVVADGANLL